MRSTTFVFPRLLLSTLVGVLLALSLPACDRTTNNTEAEHVQRAKEFQDKGDLQTATIEFKNALQKNPKNAEARWLLGEVYVLQGLGKDAERELRQAFELGVNPESMKVSLGKAIFLQGDFKRVLNEIQPGANSSKTNTAKILAIRGEAHLTLGQVKEAKSDFDEAVAAQPDLTAAMLGQARIAAIEKDADRAVSLVDQALAKSPKDVDGLFMKAELQRLLKNNEAAVLAYAKLLEYYPQDVVARLNMASLQIAMGKYDDAAKNIELARKRAPDFPQTSYMQALLHFRQGKNEAALDAIQKLLAVAPDNPPGLLLAGAIQYTLKSYAQSERSLRAFLAGSRDQLFARKLLAQVLVQDKRPEEAIVALQPVLSQASDDPELLSIAGNAYMQAHQYAKAAEYLAQAAAATPKNAATRTSLAVARLATGDAEHAVADLESAIRVEPDQTDADTLVILTFLSRKDFAKALQSAQRLVERQPNSPAAYNMLGGVYLSKADFPNARKNFEKSLALDPAYVSAANNLARMDIQAKDIPAARKRFQGVLAKDAKNLDAMLALAELDASTGSPKDALPWLERARASHPEAAKPVIQLAGYYWRSNEVQKALALITEANGSHPGNPEILSLLGQLQFAAGQKENAVATYRNLAAVAPKDPAAHYQLAMAQGQVGDLSGAGQSLDTAIKLKPDYLAAQVALAELQIRGGKTAEAEKLFKGIQQQQPKLAIGYVVEGDALAARQNFSASSKAYEKALTVEKNPAVLIKLHGALARAGDKQAADARINAWLKERPADSGVRLYLASYYYTQGKLAAAAEHYRKILETEPNNALVLNDLANVYYQQKDARAQDLAERAYKAAPASAQVADTLGWILAEKGDTKRGLELLQQAAKGLPKEGDVQYHYAAALAKAGDKVAARRQLESLLAGNQTFSRQDEARALLKQL